MEPTEALEKNLYYQSLDNSTKEIIKSIQENSHRVLNNEFRLISENLNENSDMESIWTSYTIVINAAPKDTVDMNTKFIDHCIQKNLLHLLSSDIIFRFESGGNYAN